MLCFKTPMTALTVLSLVVMLLTVAVGDGARVISGQTVCPAHSSYCYKVAYFHTVSSRVSFTVALQACATDQGALVSIESEHEQLIVETLLQELRSGVPPDSDIVDGDFWIGLTRSESSDQTQTQSQNQSQTCPGLYQWTDGSSATYRYWYDDEPSCGGEACVVMYHQPTALPGVGGAYLHQWNDDRCNMKHNFICKYHKEQRSNSDSEESATEQTSVREKEAPPLTQDSQSGTLLLYILLPTAPLLILILVASGSCCCQKIHKTKSRSQTAVDQTNLWISTKA
ncbi:unnamed protein product [Knipowitschia caucasica]